MIKKLKEILNRPIKKRVAYSILIVTAILYSIHINYRWKNDMTDSWMEGCIESVIFTNNIGLREVSTLIFNMCVNRHSQIKEYE